MWQPGKLKKVVFAAALVAASCNIGTGTPSNPGVQLGVPYYMQQGPANCAPAAIEMWAAFDGNFVSQTVIANYVGCVSGTTPANTVNGVNYFTATKDAYLDQGGGQDPNFFARQISSINVDRPVAAALFGQHVGIVNGGLWHQDETTGYNVWDFVYFHDPEVAANQEYSASDWMEFNTAQIIGRSAALAAASNLEEYGASVRVRGSNYRDPIAM